jgi:Steigviridae/Suoliviridae L,D-carboxypeptidase/transpeptidase
VECGPLCCRRLADRQDNQEDKLKLLLRRYEQAGAATIGILSVDGKHECFCLEDTVRDPGVKVPGQTAIPAGTYSVTLRKSDKFQRIMPHLENVANFDGILIHWGNNDVATEGCILVGMEHEVGQDWIGSSRLAFNNLYPKLEAATDAITIEIIDDF